jgi:arachidonate 5-lipoxygenase
MAYPFLCHDIRLRSAPDLPLPIPSTRHPSRAGWVNHGIRLYQEHFGEADYLRYSREQFGLPLPPSGPEGRKALQAISRKLAFGFAMNGLKVGRRSTHMPGVGATGVLTILANPDVPESDFFVPGRRFPVRLRHSNAAFVDDAGVVPRGCALKLTQAPTGGPLDLVVNSGIAGEIFFDARNFWDFTMARLKVTPTEWSSQKEYVRKYPAAFIGAIDAHREAPSSYADLMYASKIVMEFRARDGRRRFMRYRLLRPDLERESGLLSEARQRNIWYMLRNPDDDRPRDYLREEFVRRVRRGGVTYVLQMQFLEWDDDRHTHEVFSAARAWDEVEHPWHDVARVELTDPMETADTEATRASITVHPECLRVPDADHPSDPRSLAWLRTQVYPLHQVARRLRWLVGIPPARFPAKDEMIEFGPGGRASGPLPSVGA